MLNKNTDSIPDSQEFWGEMESNFFAVPDLNSKLTRESQEIFSHQGLHRTGSFSDLFSIGLTESQEISRFESDSKSSSPKRSFSTVCGIRTSTDDDKKDRERTPPV